MSKKNIENKFSLEIDAYFNGIKEDNREESTEYNELLELGKTMANKDFSKNSNKQAVFNKTLKNIDGYKGEDIMKKSNKFKKAAIAVASIGIVSISVMQTSFAQEIAEKVIRTISLGHISVVQVEAYKIKETKLPDEFKGKVFDKGGKLVEVVTKENEEELYTAKGEKIAYMQSGIIITVSESVAEYERICKEESVEVKDSSKLNEYTCFEVKLPTFLPEGYKFDRATFNELENGTKVENSKSISLYFTNKETGKFIFIKQRVSDESTKYETGTDGKIEEIKINGVNAVISDDRSIDWEANNTLYSLTGKGEITKDELIKIAQSIK